MDQWWAGFKGGQSGQAQALAASIPLKALGLYFPIPQSHSTLSQPVGAGRRDPWSGVGSLETLAIPALSAQASLRCLQV